MSFKKVWTHSTSLNLIVVSMEYTLVGLSKKEYIASVANIEDKATRDFAQISLEWWNLHFSWRTHGCVALRDVRGVELSYIFYKIDRYCQNLNIHTLFTPQIHRDKGYARETLRLVFQRALAKSVSRFHLSCVSSSLAFYLPLGFVFWGLNSQKDYYCNMPLPQEGLASLIHNSDTTKELIADQQSLITHKIDQNHEELTQIQTDLYEKDKKFLGDSYRLREFLDFRS